ncbi:tetratricopeptide repeat protein [Desulfacinum hydrothermale]|uniref:tetratricopeptide repeat protein n=1 Tax=Desulfacinum hydrothermale TaxID=109258 RepID=UPI0014822F1C|nr:tetratricopeptide repeat protein [Desulfacinum hydrothermale]
MTSFDLEHIERLARSKFGLFRFIPMLTFGFDFFWGKGSLAAFHITNMVIHIFCWIACFFLVFQLDSLVRSKQPVKASDFLMFSAAVASVWALHPAQTSAVTYLVQRMASLQTLFYILAVAFFVGGRAAFERGKRVKPLALWVACFMCSVGAFFSKENSAMLPFMLLAVEIWFFQPDLPGRLLRKWLSSLRSIRAIFCYTILLSALVWIFLSVINHFAQGYSGRHFTMGQRLLTESRIVMHYIFAILVPNPNFLSLEHDVKLSTSLLSPPTTLFSLIALSGLIYFALVYRRRYPLITFGILWFLLNLTIESTIVPLELIFDHRMYLPSVGLILAVLEGVRLVGNRFCVSLPRDQRQKLAWSSLAIVCSLLSLLTFYRNEDWKDIVSINKDAVQKAPNNPRAHSNYSLALKRAGRYQEALDEAYKAIELGQDGFEEHVVATTSIVSVYMEQESWGRAIAEGERLLEEKPSRFDATSLPILYLKLAECHRMVGNLPQCYHYIVKATHILQQFPSRLSTDKRWVYVVMNSLLSDAEKENVDLDGDGSPDPGMLSRGEWIARKLYELGDYEAALRYAQMLPGSPVAEDVIQNISLFRERTQEQSEEWSFAKKYLLRPWNVSSISLATAYAIRKYKVLRPLRAVGEKLLDRDGLVDDENPDTHLLRGWFAFEEGRYEAAVAEAKKSLELTPQYAKAWIALGFFEQAAGRAQEALTAFRQTLELYPGYPKRRVLKELMAKLESEIPAGPTGNSSTQHASLM